MSARINLANNVWDAIVILCASYVAIFIPLDMIFELKSEMFFVSDQIITWIFLVDLVVNVYKYREIKKTLNYQDDNKSKLYLKGLILTDLLAALPFGLLLNPAIFRLLRLVKLLRVINLFQTFRNKQIQLSGLLTFLFFIFWILHIIHWLGCGWCAIRGLDPDLDPTTNYINAIYWTITTLTTVGYGDILPVNNPQPGFFDALQNNFRTFKESDCGILHLYVEKAAGL